MRNISAIFISLVLLLSCIGRLGDSTFDDNQSESPLIPPVINNNQIKDLDGFPLLESMKPTVTPHNSPEFFQYDEEFSNDFEGAGFGSNWEPATHTFETIDFHPSNVETSDGKLKVWIRHNDHMANYGQGRQIHMYFQSGMLKSKKKCTYGYYEARIKGSKVFKGTCSAFWLYNIPWEKVPGSDYQNKVVYNEIDVIELQQVPLDYHIMSTNYHIMVQDKQPDGSYKRKFIRPNDMWGRNECKTTWDSRDDYHLYACENRPDSLIWYIDNVRVASVPNYYWHLPVNVVLSVEPRTPYEKYVNGVRYPVETTEAEADNAGFPCCMEVDYVKVWRRKDYSKFRMSKRMYDPSDFK